MTVRVEVETRVEIFPDRLEAIANDPGGPVSVRVHDIAEQVRVLAAAKVGTKYSGHHLSRGPLLKDSGILQKQTDSAGWIVRFIHPIAHLHHQGTTAKGYLIPRGGKPNITLKNGRKIVFLKRTEPIPFGPRFSPVTHPGSDGNPFLLDATDELGLRRSGALKRGAAGPFPVVRTGFA